MRRLASRVLVSLLVLGFAVGAVPPADAQKRGGTLTIVRPTDPVSLDPNLETTAPGAWVYFNMLEGLLTLDEKMQVKPSLATSYEVHVAHQGALQAAAQREVPRRHAVQRRGRAASRYDRALKGNPPARWASLAGSLDHAEVVGRPHRRRRDQGAVRADPPHAGHVLHGHRVAARRCRSWAQDFSRAPVGHGAVQVRGVEDQHPRDHRAEHRLLGRQGARRPRDLQGRARGRRADDRAPDRATPTWCCSPRPPSSRRCARIRSSRSTRRPASASCSPACTPGMPPLDDVRVRQALLHAVDRKAILDNIMEGSAGPARGVLAPGVLRLQDMQLDQLYPFDRARAKALLAQAGWTPGPDGIMQKGGRSCRCRGWPRAAAIPRTARSPRPSRPCSRRSGSRPRCRSSSGPPCSSRSAATRSTTTCSRWAG